MIWPEVWQRSKPNPPKGKSEEEKDKNERARKKNSLLSACTNLKSFILRQDNGGGPVNSVLGSSPSFGWKVARTQHLTKSKNVVTFWLELHILFCDRYWLKSAVLNGRVCAV